MTGLGTNFGQPGYLSFSERVGETRRIRAFVLEPA